VSLFAKKRQVLLSVNMKLSQKYYFRQQSTIMKTSHKICHPQHSIRTPTPTLTTTTQIPTQKHSHILSMNLTIFTFLSRTQKHLTNERVEAFRYSYWILLFVRFVISLSFILIFTFIKVVDSIPILVRNLLGTIQRQNVRDKNIVICFPK
jgi:hypothetical protein